AERKDSSHRKIYGDRIIYQTKELDRPKKLGFPVLCDFGEARGQATYTGDVQPDQYRAPEVILDMPWLYEIDMWNAGVPNLFVSSKIVISSRAQVRPASSRIVIIWRRHKPFWASLPSTFFGGVRPSGNTTTHMERGRTKFRFPTQR
ncbi:hypothetical protein LTR95_009921, partial [Oleoguttula sp. CCFEE 5521]